MYCICLTSSVISVPSFSFPVMMDSLLSHRAGATSLMANVGLAEFLSFVVLYKLQYCLLSLECKHHHAVTSS